MSSVVEQLIEMGFSRVRAETAVTRTGTNDVQVAMDWILSHDEDVEIDGQQLPTPPKETETSSQPNESTENVAATTEAQAAKSIKCDDCGKLFKSQGEVEFHASKSGHENFSESTEEKKPMTEEEKKETLVKIEAKLRQRRLDREAKEKLEELEREKSRIKSGKELLEAKKKHEEVEMKKIVELRKREKEEERLAKQRVREQIEQDKLARRAKFGGPTSDKIDSQPVTTSKHSMSKPTTNYTEVKLQIRLTNGSALTQTFGAKEPLSAVRLYIEMNREDTAGPFNLMVPFPKKIFSVDDYDKPLDTLGLAPSAVLIVSKSL